jgi:hypothetical protein
MFGPDARGVAGTTRQAPCECGNIPLLDLVLHADWREMEKTDPLSISWSQQTGKKSKRIAWPN